jgi:hypothetical protein
MFLLSVFRYIRSKEKFSDKHKEGNKNQESLPFAYPGIDAIIFNFGSHYNVFL